MWEYTTRIRPVDLNVEEPLPDDPIVMLANKMAKEGWELVTTTAIERNGLPHVLLTFRRPA